MSVYDLYQSYLNQMQMPAPAAQSNILDPSYLLYLQQQQRGGDGQGQDYDPTKDTTPTANLGINSLSDLTGMISTPGIIGGLIAGIPGAIIGRGVSNFMDPNRDIFGRLNETGIAAQARNMAEARDLSRNAAISGARVSNRDAARGTSGGGISNAQAAASQDAARGRY